MITRQMIADLKRLAEMKNVGKEHAHVVRLGKESDVNPNPCNVPLSVAVKLISEGRAQLHKNQP